jgi:hypothetical protein
MNMKIVALPSRRRIIARSALKGAGLGAGTGTVVIVVIALLGASPALLIFAPIAAAVGLVMGGCCGTLGGLALAAARSSIVGRPLAVRLTAGVGASLLPGAWEAAVLGHVGDGAWRVALVLAVTFWLAFAAGPAALYGRRPSVPSARITATPRPRRQGSESAPAAEGASSRDRQRS